jgi:catechol 2,3-dioxygenase-like lactoylglutathione lyase family enzyme
MDADADGHAQRPKISAGVAACLIRVCDLDRSLKFYCDVFSCRVALRQGDVALLLAPSGFELYLNAHEWIARRRRPGSPLLMWATESESDLQQIARRLRAHDTGVYADTENGVTLVEGSDPRRSTRDRRLSQPPPASPHGDTRTTPQLTPRSPSP